MATTQNKMKKTMIIFGAILFASFILSSCGGGNSNEPETTIKEPAAANEDCMASTQAELEVCLKDKPISDLATVGFYYWKTGSDFVKYAEQMIQTNIRVNNEFYVCPVFNEAISDNKQIRIFNANNMWGLGTPEDLEVYIKNFNIERKTK